MIRRKYIVDAKFQWAIVGYSVVISLLTSSMHITLERLSAVKTLPHTVTAIVFGIFYLGIFVLAVLFSNRLAGPLFRLRRHILEAARGKPLQKIFFREKDFFTDLNQAYNEYVDAIPKLYKKNEGGFTLAELMVVVGIIGLLATLAVTTSVTQKTKDNYEFKSELSTLTEALNTARSAAFTKNQCAFVTRGNAQTLTIETFAIPSPCNTLPLPPADLSQVVRFSSSTTVSAFSIGNVLVFRPSGGLTVATPVTINISSASGNQNTVTIYPAIGQVRHL